MSIHDRGPRTGVRRVDLAHGLIFVVAVSGFGWLSVLPTLLNDPPVGGAVWAIIVGLGLTLGSWRLALIVWGIDPDNRHYERCQAEALQRLDHDQSVGRRRALERIAQDALVGGAGPPRLEP